MPDPDIARCVTCRYFADTVSECRRHAPAAITPAISTHVHTFVVGWPQVNDDDWCGEYVCDPHTAQEAR